MAIEAAEPVDFADLYEREARGILAYLRAHSPDWQQAEDLAAETFLRAWTAWPRFARRGIPERIWLLRIARNLVIDDARRRATAPPALHVEPATGDTTSGPALARAALGRALIELPEEARELIGLRAAGLSFGEIGELTGRSEDAAKMAWHRAARKLRAEMEAAE